MSKTMIHSKAGLVMLDWPAPVQVKAGYTLRSLLGADDLPIETTQGASLPPCEDFNLAHHVGDNADAVAFNRDILQRVVNKPICWLSQTHTTIAVKADAPQLGVEADAAWVDNDQWAAAVMTADCLPVFFCNDAGDWVAVAHAGWRGLAGGILGNTLSQYTGNPSSLMAYLGPAIGPTAFEVGDDVRDAFMTTHDQSARAFSPGVKPGKWWADIYALARMQLQHMGIQRIYGGTHCTFNEADHFFSYRRDGATGRMANVIWIESE